MLTLIKPTQLRDANCAGFYFINHASEMRMNMGIAVKNIPPAPLFYWNLLFQVRLLFVNQP